MVAKEHTGFKREYFLDYNGAAITVWASLWSGLMIVNYNDVEVGRSRAFGLTQTISFQVDGKPLEATVRVKNILSDLITVTLTENGEIVAETTQAMFGKDAPKPLTRRHVLKTVTFYAFFGFLGGFLSAEILHALGW